nr:hypothetical protein [Candidatus Methylobacter oryzae]
MLPWPVSLSVLADQVTGLLTKMSPLPPVEASVAMVTLPPPKLVASVAAPIPEVLSTPLPALIVKSTGSISQVPLLPFAAFVVILASSATLTWAAEVSMKPPFVWPSPPVPLTEGLGSGALASSVPPTLTVPLSMSPSSLMTPLRSSTVRASMTPSLLTTVDSSASAALAVISTVPPSVWINCLFSASACNAPLSTCTLTSLSPANSSVILSPAANAAVPNLAWMTPWLLTRSPSKAM